MDLTATKDLAVMARYSFENIPAFWFFGGQVTTYAGGEARVIHCDWKDLVREVKDHAKVSDSKVLLIGYEGHEVALLINPKEVDLYERVEVDGVEMEHVISIVYRGRHFVIPVKWDDFEGHFFPEQSENNEPDETAGRQSDNPVTGDGSEGTEGEDG